MNIETAKKMVKAQEHIERIELFIEKVPSWGVSVSASSSSPILKFPAEDCIRIARKQLRAAKAQLKALQENP